MPNYIASIEIYDEEQSLGFWKRNGFDNPAYVADTLIRVSSISDMVTKVLSAMGNQKERVELFFKGTGSVNYQSVGAGAMQDASGERSFQVDSNGVLNQAAKIWLPRLKGRVSGIYLLGVDSKANLISKSNAASFPLLLAISQIFIGSRINGRIEDGIVVVNYGESQRTPIELRTQAERERLRKALSKLDRR